ncbi:MAG TPA: hypothetical protein VG818_01075, partial [Gemmatimonadaceae bacterium]|nr:hypothetical protein [Gemmatimonadaceae bacterium]
MTPDTLSRRAAHAEILLWQGKLRLAIALIAGAAEFVLLQAMGTGARSGWLFSAVAGYAAIVGVIAFGASRRHQVPEAAVTATVLADIAFIFAMTLVGSGPAYYDRILLAAFFALFAAALYFGRAHGLIGLVAAVLGYLLVVQRAVAGDGGLVWPEELFSLGVFVTATVAAFALCGSQHTRMDKIARLIERAEEGDFSVAYDEDADTRPDAVTAVGRSFNRV